MSSVQRVTIHDKQPVFELDMLHRLLDRAVMVTVPVALLIQLAALTQVIWGRGFKYSPLDHFSFALVAFLWLALGVLVFLQRRAHHAGQIFLLSAVAGATFLCLTPLYQVTRAEMILFTAGLLLFPTLLLGFTRALLETRTLTWREGLLYLPPVLLIGPAVRALLYNGAAPLAFRVAMVSVAGYLLASIGQCWLDLRRAQSPQQATQLRALLVGLTAGTVPGIPVFIVPLVTTGHLQLSLNWLPPLILIFLIAMSYATLLFELAEADLTVRRGVVYGLVTLVVVVAYAVLGVVLDARSASLTSLGGGLGFVGVTVLVGATFVLVRNGARRLVDRGIYGRRAGRWELLESLSERLATVMQPDQLGEVLVQDTVEALHLRGAFLLRRTERGDFVPARASNGVDSVPIERMEAAELEPALGDPPSPLLLVHAKPLTSRGLEPVPAAYRRLDAAQAALSIPLVTRSGLEAVLCLQPKLAHDPFDAEDLELMAPVIRQASAALDNALLFARLQEKVDELRQAYRRIAGEQETERARLARELHDGTAQELAGLITLATVAEKQMSGNPAAAETTLSRLRLQAENAYQDVRRISHGLRPALLDDFGLAPTLTRYLEQFQTGTGINVDATVEELGELPTNAELALFRVAQECLENVRKHSGSHAAQLCLRRGDGQVVLTVEDRGQGFSTQQASGIGLVGMRERVEAVGGTVRVHSMPGEGVRIEATVPDGANGH